MGRSNEILFSLPGRIGDNLLRWPAVFHFWRRSGRRVVVGLDQESYPVLAPLLIDQPPVTDIVRFENIDVTTGPGGQPWDLGFQSTDYDRWEEVYHLGYRSHPDRSIIQLSCARVPFALSSDELEARSLLLPPRKPQNRCILHGTLPGPKYNRDLYWSFLLQTETVLRETFSELCFVGNEEERACAEERGYQTVLTGTFKEAAQLLSESQAVVAGPSSIAALAGVMQVPCFRVHDNNPHAPAETWANVGAQQVNYLPWQTPPIPALQGFVAALTETV